MQLEQEWSAVDLPEVQNWQSMSHSQVSSLVMPEYRTRPPLAPSTPAGSQSDETCHSDYFVELTEMWQQHGTISTYQSIYTTVAAALRETSHHLLNTASQN